MKTVTINPTVASTVHIGPVIKSDVAPVRFKAKLPLDGTFEVKVWNSDKKNEVFEVPEVALVKNDDMLTFTIDAALWNFNPKSYYYEIHKIESKRIYFKGNLTITE